MTKIQNSKQYDLEERTLDFGKRIIHLSKTLPKNTINFRLIDQLVRSDTSIGANYREANEM
jgi:four helix bundle protein